MRGGNRLLAQAPHVERYLLLPLRDQHAGVEDARLHHGALPCAEALRRYFLGPVLGALVGVIMPEWLRDVPKAADWYLPIFGAAVVLMMVWLPDGLLSLPDRIKAKRLAREASAARAVVGQTASLGVKS